MSVLCIFYFKVWNPGVLKRGEEKKEDKKDEWKTDEQTGEDVGTEEGSSEEDSEHSDDSEHHSMQSIGKTSMTKKRFSRQDLPPAPPPHPFYLNNEYLIKSQ